MAAKKKYYSTADIVAMTKRVLITNLAFIQLNYNGLNLRLDAHALLLEENTLGFAEPVHMIRAFGMDSAWPVFTLWLSQSPLPYTLTDADSKHSAVLLQSDTTLKPIFSGAVLRTSEAEMFLQVQNDHHPLDVQTFDTGYDVTALWKMLGNKTIHYWNHPGRPQLTWKYGGRA